MVAGRLEFWLDVLDEHQERHQQDNEYKFGAVSAAIYSKCRKHWAEVLHAAATAVVSCCCMLLLYAACCVLLL